MENKDVLQTENRLLREENIRLKGLLGSLMSENNDLKERLGLNSSNSSKPPSNDHKKNTTPSAGKKKGPPHGHKGVCRKLYSDGEVDHFHKCSVEVCPHCGSSSLLANSSSPVIHQQVELVSGKIFVTQYERIRYRCTCCNRNTTSPLPQGIINSAFGIKLSSVVALLTGKYHISKRESKSLLDDLFQVKISLGSISAIEKRVAAALEPLYDEIRVIATKNEEVSYVDETGWRNSGKNCYVWVASTATVVYFNIRSRQNRETCYDFLGKDFCKPLVTDRKAVYNCYEKIHQWCLSHILRNFQGMSERKGIDGIIGKGLKCSLQSVFKHWHLYKDNEISFETFRSRCGYYRGKIKDWLEEGFFYGTEKFSRFCDALLNRFDWLWTFLKCPGMEPTNNMVERDLRGLVIWRKKSFGTRSIIGQRYVERISSIVLTARKRSSSVLLILSSALTSYVGGNIDVRSI